MSRELSIVVDPIFKIQLYLPIKEMEGFKNQFPNLTDKIRQDRNNSNLYTLAPMRIEVCAPGLIAAHHPVSEVLDKSGEEVYFNDFDQSYELYVYCSNDKKKTRIINDDFSNQRGGILHQTFARLETRLRIQLLSDQSLLKIVDGIDSKSIKGRRAKEPDYKLSQIALSEIFNHFLLSPCSEDYIAGQFEASAKKSGDVIKIRSLRIVDEIKFPLTEAELKRLGRIRNATMHFKVITLDDYKFAIDSVNLYVHYIETKDLMRVLAESLQPAIKDALKSLSNIDFTAINNSFSEIAERMKKLRS